MNKPDAKTIQRRQKMTTLFCQQPDRDQPRMTCGYPLPCPWHTVTVDLATQTITEPVTAQVSQLARYRLKEIVQALHTDNPQPVRPDNRPGKARQTPQGKARKAPQRR